MKKKVCMMICLFMIVTALSMNVYVSSFLNEIINKGNSFGTSSGTLGISDPIESFVKDSIQPLVRVVGSLIIASVTIILGAKYIWSGAEGRAQVMNTLPAFILGVIFFTSADTLLSIVKTANLGDTWDTFSNNIYATIAEIVRLLAFGGILFMGIRYLFASAEGKAELKTNMTAVVIGLTLVFSASSVVSYIINIGKDIL